MALKVASSARVGWAIGGCEAEGVGAVGDVSRQVGGRRRIDSAAAWMKICCDQRI